MAKVIPMHRSFRARVTELQVVVEQLESKGCNIHSITVGAVRTHIVLANTPKMVGNFHKLINSGAGMFQVWHRLIGGVLIEWHTPYSARRVH